MSQDYDGLKEEQGVPEVVQNEIQYNYIKSPRFRIRNKMCKSEYGLNRAFEEVLRAL